MTADAVQGGPAGREPDERGGVEQGGGAERIGDAERIGGAEPGLRSHAPAGYVCPFCGLVAGDTSDAGNRCEVTDTVYQDEDVIVLIAADGFGEHEGHAMVCPAEHHENLYELPDRVLARIALTARQVALAMKAAWQPDGVSTRQHNEPAGNQHVWHYHLHVFPRYEGDMLYRQLRHAVDPGVRAARARELAAVLDMGPTRL